MRYPILILILAIAYIVTAVPALAQENPYRNAGNVNAVDVALDIGADNIATSDTSSVKFDGAGYTHTIGRVTIRIVPLPPGLDKGVSADGNKRTSGTDNTVTYEVYRDLIKERITLKSPEKVAYSYDLALSDWVTNEPDESRPEKTIDANNTAIITYPHTKQVTNYAKDSTIDISPDRWGNLIVYVNGEDVVVMPKPYAIDAGGKRFELEYTLDKKAKTIAVTGDLAGAQYPLVVDPTERVTNGGFEDGTTAGWSVSPPAPSLSIISGGANQGTYYCRYQGNGYSGTEGYSQMYRTIDYSGVDSVSMAVKVLAAYRYDFVLSDGYWQEAADGTYNYAINFPGQSATGWVSKSARSTLSGGHRIQFWTYYTNAAGIDSISAVVPDAPVADFSGTPTSGYRPLTVGFTDQSTNSPTSWSWTFGDGGTSASQNPSHQYTSAGTYTVSLTATNGGGSDAETKTGYITVTTPPPPVANFTGTPTNGYKPLTVKFTDLSTNSPTSWSWDFGDGDSTNATAQNPVHTYNSAGSYTVELTATNSGGSDAEEKVDYVTVTNPALNQATDIEGRTDVTGVIEDAAVKQTARNYNPTTYIQPSRSIVKSRLPDDQIFFFDGHGNPGTIQTNVQPDERFFAQNSIDGYDFDASSSTYGNMKLAVFLGCHTGETDPDVGNLVDVVTSKGASCAMGWTDVIVTEGGAPWSSAFWSAIRDGKTVNQAHDDGLNAAKDYPICKMLDPPSIWQYCKLENVYSQGSGCIHPLPEGMLSLANQPLISDHSEVQIKENFADTQIQKFQIQERQTIQKNSGKSGIHPKYEKSVHYTYGTLDIYTTDNATYKINRETGRVQSQYNKNSDTQSGTDVINLDQGYSIAEAYAKKNSPEIWTSIPNTTQTIIKSISQTTQGHDLAYSWRQYISSQNLPLNQSTEIAGFNSVDVTLDARDGEVTMYHEWYQPLDASLNLNPDISEEQAWDKVRQFYENAGYNSIENSERENFGLNIAIDEKNNQHLTWQFQIRQKAENGFDIGGQIGIDAHNGQVVWRATIG